MPRNASFAVLPPSSDLAPLVDGLRTDSKLAAQLLYTAYLPGSETAWGELDPPLSEPVARALGRAASPGCGVIRRRGSLPCAGGRTSW